MVSSHRISLLLPSPPQLEPVRLRRSAKDVNKLRASPLDAGQRLRQQGGGVDLGQKQQPAAAPRHLPHRQH
uniref:Uncharacterized protein n=1 Tax=Oryza glumipatula TaxID=40148 RepID=A0A0E0BJQ5_9ORYZ